MQTDMLVSGFPGRGYLSAASPMLVALCTCVISMESHAQIISCLVLYKVQVSLASFMLMIIFTVRGREGGVLKKYMFLFKVVCHE